MANTSILWHLLAAQQEQYTEDYLSLNETDRTIRRMDHYGEEKQQQNKQNKSNTARAKKK